MSDRIKSNWEELSQIKLQLWHNQNAVNGLGSLKLFTVQEGLWYIN